MDMVGDAKMEEGGILKGLIDATPLKGLGISPQLLEKEIVIELTTEQLRNMLLQHTDEKAKQYVTVELHEGKLVLKIRLW
jgi:hypothetical protein